MWRSPVARRLWEPKVSGSNPDTPIEKELQAGFLLGALSDVGLPDENRRLEPSGTEAEDKPRS